MPEKRKYPRIGLDTTIRYRIKKPRSILVLLGDEEVKAAALDLSEEGLALTTECDLPLGTNISVNFNLIDTSIANHLCSSEPLEVFGQVRSNIPAEGNQHRLGVRFMDIEPGSKNLIRNFVNGILSLEPLR
jgi:c-di-GMP-binding flagellar brake protein YcgR